MDDDMSIRARVRRMVEPTVALIGWALIVLFLFWVSAQCRIWFAQEGARRAMQEDRDR